MATGINKQIAVVEILSFIKKQIPQNSIWDEIITLPPRIPHRHHEAWLSNIALFQPRLCSDHLLRSEKLLCQTLAGFHDFASQHIYYYAFGKISLQVLVLLRFFNPRDDASCIIWDKNGYLNI
jgi:hypothetical protein